MSGIRYDVVFYGEILAGFTPEAVKEAFSRLFKLSEERVEQIFSASRVTLKPGLDQLTAEKYQRTLEGIGALTLLEERAPEPVAEEDTSEDADTNAYAEASEETSEAEATEAESNAADEEAVAAVPLDEPREMRFQFHGSGGEYFKIWIVNILLSILTLGIYSAWAKVRNKQYFYGNTEFEGSTFSYLASPITILKGRLIALAIVIAYSLATNTPIWWVSAIALGAMLLVSPFFVQRSLMFNARNSAYRNIRFNFAGSFKEAAIIFAGLPIVFIALFAGSAFLSGAIEAPWLAAVVMLLLFAFAMPYFVYRQKDYFVANSEFGTAGFDFTATRNEFFSVWMKLVGWTIVAFIGAFIAAFLVAMIFGVSLAALGGGEAEEGASMAGMIPMILSMYIIIGIAYLFPFIYYSVRINNLVFNNSSVNGFQLNSDYEIMSYGKLVIVNTILTLLTLGLFRPWAMVRTAQYKADHISVVAVNELDSFVAGEEEHVNALGEEVGDFYDLDFGF